jgi:hypothetical protein
VLEILIIETGEGREGKASEKEDDEDHIKIFPMLDSPSSPGPWHTVQIQVGVQGRPTGTIAPRYGAKEPVGGSPVTESTVWPLPPPPTSSAPLSSVQPTPPPREEDDGALLVGG